MATLNDILTALQNCVQAVNNISNTFPPITGLTSAAPAIGAGATTFNSSQPIAFGTVRTSSGGVYQIPLYP